ncbi:hypothetical protein N7530_010785 [Penicillium desertorum]|uniref:FAD/NAD(P)-binding domain-containing protein n=1 Tax=Penicillium desertorum TaxID=1303715 RepID=A0A9X0BH13_9EURO|nr:hypothetical protein N7530_010785 [Penicillium desertorum]
MSLLSDKPGFSEAFGKGLFWCSQCDGLDYKGCTMVILGKPGNFAGAIGSALNLRKLRTNIQIFAGGKITDADKKNAEARWSGWETVIKKTYDISIHEADTIKIERTAKGKEPYDDEYKLTLDGSIRTLITIGMDGTSVKVVFNMESSIGGIYVVGDANNDGSTNAYHAMWSAKRAVVNAHVALNKEEYLEQVPGAMVAAEGGDEEFYQGQIDKLHWVIGKDVEELYKTLGA